MELPAVAKVRKNQKKLSYFTWKESGNERFYEQREKVRVWMRKSK